MNRGVKKGTRMVYWSYELGLSNFTWLSSLSKWIGRGGMDKKEIKRFLSEFNVSDFPQYDIISVKIVRHKRVGTTMTWTDEVIGYTDVTPQGFLYPIEF